MTKSGIEGEPHDIPFMDSVMRRSRPYDKAVRVSAGQVEMVKEFGPKILHPAQARVDDRPVCGCPLVRKQTERLWPDTQSHILALRQIDSDTEDLPCISTRPPCPTVAAIVFIVGLPIKRATSRLAGRS